jgi:hypothetical protein
MARELRAHLDQRLAQAGQRPRLRCGGHRQRPLELAVALSRRERRLRGKGRRKARSSALRQIADIGVSREL